MEGPHLRHDLSEKTRSIFFVPYRTSIHVVKEEHMKQYICSAINKHYLMTTMRRRRRRSRNHASSYKLHHLHRAVLPLLVIREDLDDAVHHLAVLALHVPHHLTADAGFGRGRGEFPVLDVQLTVHQDVLLVLLGTDPIATHSHRAI